MGLSTEDDQQDTQYLEKDEQRTSDTGYRRCPSLVAPLKRGRRIFQDVPYSRFQRFQDIGSPKCTIVMQDFKDSMISIFQDVP